MTIPNDQAIKPPAEEKPLPCPFCGSNDIYECRDEYNAFCGERGYVRRQLAKLLGFHETHKGGRFARFLADFVPNSLSALEKTREPILLPSGRQA